MLQTAVGSLESADCDTEWLIGINVVTGGVLFRKNFQEFRDPLLST